MTARRGPRSTTMVEYLEDGVIKYAPGPSTTNPVPYSSRYDSDGEPLIGGSPHGEDDEYGIQHFTLSGRPRPPLDNPTVGQAGWGFGAPMYGVPPLPSVRYNDDSIIPAIVMDVLPSQRTRDDAEESNKKKRKGGGFLSKFKAEKKEEEGEKKMTKVVYMPRRDYLKWFARDRAGMYNGTEPYRQWSVDELDDNFKKYQPQKVGKTYRRGG